MQIEMVGAPSGGVAVGDSGGAAARLGSSKLKRTFNPQSGAQKKKRKRQRRVLAELDVDGDVEMIDSTTAEELDAELDEYNKRRHLLGL